MGCQWSGDGGGGGGGGGHALVSFMWLDGVPFFPSLHACIHSL